MANTTTPQLLHEIYRLDEQLEQLYEAADGEETIETMVVEAHLHERKQDAISGLVSMIRMADAVSTAAAAEVERVQAVKRRADKRAAWARRVIVELLGPGSSPVDVGLTRVSVRHGRPRIQPVGAGPDLAVIEGIDPGLVRVERKLNRAAARRAIEAGIVLPGLMIANGPPYVQLR